jgi:hypothetical protein
MFLLNNTQLVLKNRAGFSYNCLISRILKNIFLKKSKVLKKSSQIRLKVFLCLPVAKINY